MIKKRLDLKVGFSCNNFCRHCVQAHKRDWGDKSTERIKRELKEGREDGVSDLVLTGGEPTIRKDIIDLVKYAKELGYETIQIQSNGRMFSYKPFCEKLIKAGVNEFGPALNGHIPELHDFLSSSSGAFKQTVQGIKNLKELNQRVITNTVVTKPNYRYLPEIATLFVKLGVDQFQFAFVHAGGNAWKNFEMIVPRVSLAAPYIHKGLQIGIDAGIKVMAEAMPYCVMKGYERYVSELYIPETEVMDAKDKIKSFTISRQKEGKTKFPQCKKCKYELICEGPWREYPQKMGAKEFQPVEGKKIKSITEILNVV
ncbi:MAG: radical SAM protein [Candidatus Aenigmarchaeota archaeon]|nr:radical SAM protein [Candidatus Aenigmarchaeota archaeon]